MPARTLPGLGAMLLSLFVVSGLAGLIYQSLWSHYLGLTLGHAAYAQGLVLAIFMGGMALGAWLAGQRGVRWKRLLMLYAAAEALIGLFGLAFPGVFASYTALSQDRVLPALGVGLAGQLYPWVSAALLILPACVLLGATFPLLSAGYLRASGEPNGRVFGGLYFANSLGAAAGALVATFLLLPAYGLPGAMRFAGVANLLVAAGAALVSLRLHEQAAPAPVGAREAAHTPPRSTDTRLARKLLLVAALSGGFSFVYEIGWIRLLNQALGTTLHAFELMLAAFLLGLAFGGWRVRRRAAALANPLQAAGFAQIWMGVSALLSLVVFAQSFQWVGWLMEAVSRNDSGYLLFSLGSAAVAIAVMFPAAFFAGMALPLFTVSLLRAGGGEAGIGRIYAANTLGAIGGVLLMMHVLIPLIGVRWGITLAAVGDALLGFWLLGTVRSGLARTAGLAALALGAALGLSMAMGKPDPREQAAGVFRSGTVRLSDESEIAFLRDGKTATIAVARSGAHDSAAIITNGKSDAAMTLSLDASPRGDEFTMVALGALPLALHPHPRSVGVIGWGSGLSTHTLLGSPKVERVETVEIEPAIHAGARMFGERVARAYGDPRSRVHFDDARRFFASGQRRYDVIVSEPSNPWVSGVASLFTREFYAFLRSHLAEDGVLVQWLQTYEIDDALLATMLAAVLQEFPDAEAYLAHNVDLIIVAYPGTRHGADHARLQHPDLSRELKRVGLGNADELALRRIGGRDVLQAFVRALNAPVHTDAHPLVALRAPAARFRGESSQTLQLLVDGGLPVLDMLDGRTPLPASADIQTFVDHRFTIAHREAATLAGALRNGPETADMLAIGDEDRLMRLEALLAMSGRTPIDNLWSWSVAAADIAEASLGLLPADDLRGAWIAPSWIDRGSDQHPAVRHILAMYAAAAHRDSAGMRQTGEAVLQLPDSLPVKMQEQALLIAQLGAIGQRDFAAVESLHQGYGVALPHSERLRLVRHLIRVWALDRRQPGAGKPQPQIQDAVPVTVPPPG
ncbi:spermine synthase [Pseudoxanthomonas wuyuanensis]|uniref:Spermine/spermidine synthase n=1 Tax=Pseudoxanthomonas wuyuanensis TaxID=1073196 RepID=A0A286CV86_9GAMM|nr:spermine synthase [Pseudoxanthomonas wuyuanensis]KAF1721387.1 spermine synthase [Pseudoxanthomonas wuyuanensis]SOD50319.1 Spermine/spermidine synthase [Pseudoxanthomonas wuyuanensis]